MMIKLLSILFIALAAAILINIPKYILRRSTNKRWRKNIAIGDRCFFINIMGEKTYCKVVAITEDKFRARVEIRSETGTASAWHFVENLRIK